MSGTGVGSRNLVGLLLIALGVVFLLETLDVFGDDVSIIGDFWPLFIIGVGFIGWAQRGFRYAMGPFLVIAIGSILLVGELTDENVWRYWPVLLIIIGLSFIWRKQTRVRSSHGNVLKGPGVVNFTHVLSGGERRVEGEFKGGSASVFLGSGKLILTDATLPSEGAVLDVTAVMGSYEVIAPDTWNVSMDADAFLGDVEDKRRNKNSHDSSVPTLAVRGSVFMGEIEVKS